MRKISPTKAISHAFTSLVTYRAAAVRIGMVWVPILFALGVVQMLVGQPDPQALELNAAAFVQIASAAVSFIAFSSMAVSWHRFILRDEMGSPLRLDAPVLRYAGNSLLIMLMALVPLVTGLVLVLLLPFISILLLPVSLMVAVAVTRLSLKLPAVALGRTDFSFKDAWASSADNLWQLLGVFLLNAAIVFGILFMLVLVLSGIGQISPAAAKAVEVVVDAMLKLFLTLFNASIFTSLYGFFVERRDF